MEKSIPALEARRQFGKLLQNVTAQDDIYLVERHGEPVAAVVPIAVYRQWKEQRSAFFARWRQAAERADLSPEEADALAREAAGAARHHEAL